MTSLRKQVKDLKLGAKKHRQDLDPEDEGFTKQIASDEDTDSDASVDQDIGREHYETVGKSKLRAPAKTKLDEKKYGGQAVSRDKIFQDVDGNDALAFEEDEDDDPFAAVAEDVSGSEEQDEFDEEGILSGDDIDEENDEDGEIDSDEAFEEGEEEIFRSKGFVFRGSGQNVAKLPVGSDEDEDAMNEDESLDGSGASEEERSDIDMEDMEGSDPDEDADTDAANEDESEDEDDEAIARPRPSTMLPAGGTDREKLKALMSNETAALASSLSASLTADAQKGVAVKKQYQTFDRLLDARIKLQKGLTATNDLPLDQTTSTDEDINSALHKAEEAALKIYATIESFRHSILELQTESQPSKKRKRPSPPTRSTDTSTLWSRITTLENSTTTHRRQTLDKWATKTRSAAPLSSSTSRLNGTTTTTQDSPLTSILDTYLNSETTKHISDSPSTSPSIYDDSHFYQSLLRDLINSRASATSISSSLPTVPLKLHASGNTSKARRIDTKASKGRKIRYTVHEKLESFMAGEGRGNSVGQWNDGAVREFFASLLGQRGMLFGDDENAGGGGGDGDEGGEGREVEALKLFST